MVATRRKLGGSRKGVVDPAQKVGRPVPQLEIISSPYRRILTRCWTLYYGKLTLIPIDRLRSSFLKW
jgi:hypothetical protein